jgi:hypothetical protein
MKKGDILFHPQFKFTNGEIGKKYLVILNNPDLQKSEPFLLSKTTSNPKGKPEKQGCYSERNLYVLDPGYDFFPEKTWIQFFEIFEAQSNELIKDHFKYGVEIRGTLREQTTNALINCIKKSDDVSEYHLSFLRK